METVTPTQKKARLFRAWSAGFPVWCAWQVTYRCNFRCRFCRYWLDPMGRQPEAPAGLYEQGARKLARLGTLLVSLAGGEPLLRTDLPELVEAVGRYHFPFITTNGWFATPALAEDLMRAGLWGVSVSLDYADAEKHDRARGRPGAFDRAVRAIEAFARARRRDYQRVNVMTVLLQDNLDQMEPLIRLAADHNAWFTVQPYGRRKTGST